MRKNGQIVSANQFRYYPLQDVFLKHPIKPLTKLMSYVHNNL